MVKCTFCGSEISKGTGKLFIYKSGRIAHFCSMKCEKNLLKLGRNPKKFKWSTHYEKGKKKIK